MGFGERIRSRLTEEDARSLALLRIVVAGLVLTSPELWSSMAWDAATPALRTPPEGLHWFAAHVPLNPVLVNGARGVVGVSALAGLLGLFTRPAFAVLTASSFYLFALAELVGAARHNMHLFWFTVLLAVSPSGAHFSVDAWRSKRRPDPLEVGVAVWTARALLATVYFFPGYHKLRESGLHWIFSDNLRNQMYWKWYQNASLPAFRLDEHPVWLRAGALGVVALEVTFPLLILTRKGRVAAALGGLAFHLSAGSLMYLGFASLWLCYVVLVDVPRVVGWFYDAPAPAEPGAPPPSSSAPLLGALPKGTTLVSLFLVVANVVQGARGAVQAWPFACYPTFQYEAGTDMPDLDVLAVSPGGTETLVLRGTAGRRFREQREWGLVWKLLGAYGGPASLDGLMAYYRRNVAIGLAANPPAAARSLRFYRAEYSTLPEDRGKGPTRRVLVGEITLP